MSATTTIVTGSTGPRDVQPVRRGFDWGQPFVYLVALVIAAIAVGPVIYVFLGGLRTTPDLNANPAGLPDPWTLQNWAEVLGAPRFWGNVFASTVLAVAINLTETDVNVKLDAIAKTGGADLLFETSGTLAALGRDCLPADSFIALLEPAA